MVTASNLPLPRRSPKQARGSFALESILDAAARTLAAHGKTGLTTQRVADIAGFSIGALYRYFSNKEGLIEAVALRELERMTLLIEAALAAPARFGVGSNVRRMIRAIASFMGDRPRLYGILRAEWSEAPPDSPIGQRMMRFFALIARTIDHDSAEIGERVADETARFVLVRAISGVLLATASERPECLRTRSFEDEMVRLILGFVSDRLPQSEPA